LDLIEDGGEDPSVVAYVDIRSPLGGAISALTRNLTTLGATVMSTRNSSVTHVIFRKGDPDTKYWAEKRGLFIVTPAWVTACSKEKIRVPEACYYIKEKEDVELENDFKLIAMRNASSAASRLHSDSILSSDPTINHSLLTIPETPNTGKTFLDDSDISHPPSSAKRNPPPGWKCLPSPQQPSDLMFLAEYPSSMNELPHPHIDDIKRMPLSPDVVNSVVYNMATSSAKRTQERVRKPRRALAPPFKPAVVTPEEEEEIMRKSLSPIKSTKNRKVKPRSSSFRKELLKKILKSKSKPPTSDETVKEPVKPKTSLGIKTRNKSKPLRKSARLLAKANVIVVDSEISLNSSTMNISSSDPRDSLEDFIETSSVKQRRQTKSRIQIRSPPIEILFSGLNSFQRQTLITLLRSCPSLSKHEINPSINERLCGAESASGEFSASSKSSSAAVVAAMLGSSSEEDPAAARRWRLADHFAPSTTHLITCRDSSIPSTSHSCPRTVNLFRALMGSVPVVDQSWIEESAKAAKWLPHQRFLVSGLPSSKSAAAKMRTLFSKVGDIFIASGTSPPSNVLKDLIIAGGGSISRRPFGAALVVGQHDAKRPSVTPKWILGMKFRVRTNDSGSIDYFANTIQMLANLTKNCVLRIRKDNIVFIVQERSVQGGTEAWCELDQSSVFSECVCEGLSPEQDEILLEVIPEEILLCLRGINSTNAHGSGGNGIGLLTSQSNIAVGSSGVTLPRDQTTLRNFINTARSLKIKLVRRKTPCLALEVEQASISGRSRAVWHFIPVHIVPLRLWSDFEDSPDPDFDLSIFLPPMKSLRQFVDRMKHFARFITIKATGSGNLYLEINMETLARVRLTFRGLRARDWRVPEEDQASRQSNDDEEEAFSATVDIRRFSQLLSAQRVQPGWFVCNIVQDHLIQFVMMSEHSRLKYTLPASRI
uniref:BRCT domain-containing protein n=2 Tax=Hymenolepis diminuta TaxID=6216 RepID=A0A158QFA4_HYMDI